MTDAHTSEGLNENTLPPAVPAETPAETSNEAKALADIVAWSESCCAWQRVALRRLCAGEVTADDVAELTRLCKGEITTGEPLGLEHVRDAESARATVTLTGVHSVKNVNALAEGEHLTFFQKGVTVVYGDNGSGKSGYIRILKKACRARSPKDDKIIPNIYGTATGPSTATVDFTANGENRHHDWTYGKASDPLLSSVSVFDSRTANVHVDETNNVAYKPFPMKLLEDLAQLCQQVKQRLTAEIEAIQQQTPATLKNPKCRPHTAAGELIAKLDANTKPDAVHALATLSSEESARLETLTADLATDPDKAARTLLAQKARLETGIAALAVLHGAVTQDRVDDLLQRRTEYQAAAEAAAAAAHDIFANEPLPHIGAEAWRSLWESARVYSQQQAYPAQAFPFTGDGARCVLCQQELDDAAVGADRQMALAPPDQGTDLVAAKCRRDAGAGAQGSRDEARRPRCRAEGGSRVRRSGVVA